MSERLNLALTRWLQGDEALSLLAREPTALAWVKEADELEIAGIVRFIESVPPSISSERRQFLDRLLNLLALRLAQAEQLDDDTSTRIAAAYRRWGPENGQRHLLLALLSASDDPRALEEFSELVASQPPEHWAAAAMAFVPLMRRDSLPVASLFPKLLEGLSHLSVAGLILDLANHVTHERMVETHPAADRVEALGELFAGLVARLSSHESLPSIEPQQMAAARQQVTEATRIALAVCEALALIGDAAAVGKLRTALDLGHRALRTSAAIALAKLGNDDGKQVMIEMAAEPACRPQVLIAAAELEMTERIPEEFRSRSAMIEGKLAAYLAQETQFGLPPTEIRLADSRTLRWPGFEEPIECHLLHYAYHLPGGSFESAGIVGPETQTLAVQLTALSLADQYAVFAGAQADHEEIMEVDSQQWQDNQQQLAENFLARLQSEGYQLGSTRFLAFFFGDVRLVADATDSAGTVGSVVADLRQTTFYPAAGGNYPIRAHIAYCLHKGREFLQAFNPDDDVLGTGEPPTDVE